MFNCSSFPLFIFIAINFFSGRFSHVRDDDINEADFANHQGKFVLLFYCVIEKSSSLWPLL